MAELRVPVLADSAFREHYLELIRTSVERSTETQGRKRSPRSGKSAPARFGKNVRSTVRTAWLVAFVLLAVDLVVAGVDSWTTSVFDVVLIVTTLAWFWVCVDDPVRFRAPGDGKLAPFE